MHQHIKCPVDWVECAQWMITYEQRSQGSPLCVATATLMLLASMYWRVAVHQFDWMQLCLESKATTLYSWCATVVIAGGEEAHIGRASESIPIIINELVWWIRASRGREDDLDKGNGCENRQQSEQRIPDLVILWQTFYCISSYDDDDDYIQGLYSRLWSNNKHRATAVWCQREAEEEGGWIVWYEGAMQTINLCIWYMYYSC